MPRVGMENEPLLPFDFRYTFGKPVQGFLRLTITKPWGRGFYDPRAIRTEKAVGVQGNNRGQHHATYSMLYTHGEDI